MDLSFHEFCGSLSLMRDSPQKLPIEAFAKKLGCSVDTAKRWLKRSLGAEAYVEVQKSQGGHWSVTLPRGDASLVVCRLCRELDKLTHRKRIASKAKPKVREMPRGLYGRTGADALWIAGDLHGLLRQVAEEEKKSLKAMFGLPEEELTQAVIRMWLLRGVQACQKEGQALTAEAIAKYLGMSVASLYRPPFGKAMLAAIVSRVTNTNRGEVATGAEGLSQGLTLKRQRAKIPYANRKAAFAKRREAKARHFLCWIGFDRPGLRAASLYLIHESQVPEVLRPGYPAKGNRQPFPNYSPEAMSAILTWLGQHAPSAEDKQGIGSVIQTGADRFAWECCFGGIIEGQEVSFEKAMQEVLRHVQPNRTRRRIIILNPYLNGKYEVPEWRQNLNQIGEQKD
jgi:hypothetical protein